MKPIFGTFALAFALALVAFTTVTASHTYDINDGPLIVAYGFPVPWHRANGAISMARNVDPKAAAFDFLLYLLVAFPIVLSVRTRWPGPKWLVAFLTGFGIAVGAAGMLTAIGGDGIRGEVAPTPDETRTRTTRFHFGWEFRSH